MKQTMTFGIKTEGAQKAAKDIDGVATASKKLEVSQEAFNDSVETGFGAVDKMTGGVATAFRGVAGGVKKAVLGMRTLKGAIMATGIGALVLGMASLYSYFTKTKRGAEMLEIASASLGAVFDIINDVMSDLGESITDVFNNPQKAITALNDGMKALGGWFSDLGDFIREVFLYSMLKVRRSFLRLAASAKELVFVDASAMRREIREIDRELAATTARMAEAAGAVVAPFVELFDDIVEGATDFFENIESGVKTTKALSKAAIALRDAQRNLSVEFAQTREKMTELKLVSEDVNETMEKRIEATEEMGALEQALADKSLVLAQKAVDIKRQQNALSESTEEDLQALAELEIALSNAQIESAAKQTEILMKVNSLYTEREAKAAEAIAKEAERVKGLIDQQSEIDDIVDAGRERDIQKVKDYWTEQKRIAKEAKGDLVGIEKAQRIQIAEVNKKWDAQTIIEAKQTMQQKLEIASSLIGSIMALNTALAGSSKKEQKAAFQRNKKLGIASAVINTAGAIIGAINPGGGGIALPVGLPGAIAAAISGAASIATISKSRFDSSSTETPSAPDVGSYAAGSSAAPQLDLSFLGEGATGSIQAYVISENVTNQQQADQVVTDQTTL